MNKIAPSKLSEKPANYITASKAKRRIACLSKNIPVKRKKIKKSGPNIFNDFK